MQSPILPPRAGRSEGSLSPAGQTPTPNRLQAATPPGRVNPARTPSRLEQLPRRFKGTGQGARVRTLPTHSASRPRRTRRAARSHSYKSALSPRRLAARFASPQKARVGTAATSQRPDEPGRWHLASSAAPAHPALPPLSASRSHLRALPLAADYRPKSPRTPRSLPHSAPGLPRGQGRKGSGVRHLARSSRPLTSLSKSGRRNAERKSQQKGATAGTSHLEGSSPSPAAPPSSGHISQAGGSDAPNPKRASAAPRCPRTPRPPASDSRPAQRLSSSEGGGDGGGCYSRCCRRSADAKAEGGRAGRGGSGARGTEAAAAPTADGVRVLAPPCGCGRGRPQYQKK